MDLCHCQQCACAFLSSPSGNMINAVDVTFMQPPSFAWNMLGNSTLFIVSLGHASSNYFSN